MQTPNPQEAFFSWLAESLGRAIDALRRPDGETDYLAGAVDHADLERRMRVLRRGSRHPLSQLTY